MTVWEVAMQTLAQEPFADFAEDGISASGPREGDDQACFLPQRGDRLSSQGAFTDTSQAMQHEAGLLAENVAGSARLGTPTNEVTDLAHHHPRTEVGLGGLGEDVERRVPVVEG